MHFSWNCVPCTRLIDSTLCVCWIFDWFGPGSRKVQPPKSWSGIWTKVRLKFNCGVLQWGKEKHHGVLVQMKDKHHGLMRRRSITVSWSRWRDRQGAKSREGMRATFPAGEIQLTTWIWTHFYTVSIKQPFNHPTSSLITSGSVSPFQGKLKLPTT